MSARPPSLAGTTAVLRKPAHSSQSPAPALYPSAMLPGCLAAWLETRGCPVLASGGLPDAGFNDDTDTTLSTPVKSVQPALPRVRWSAEPTGNRQPATATLSTGWHCLRTIASSVEPLRGRLTKLRPDGAVRSFACSYALMLSGCGGCRMHKTISNAWVAAGGARLLHVVCVLIYVDSRKEIRFRPVTYSPDP